MKSARCFFLQAAVVFATWAGCTSSDGGGLLAADGGKDSAKDGGKGSGPGASAGDDSGVEPGDGGGPGAITAASSGFGAIWKRVSSELRVIDADNPTFGQPVTVALPATLPDSIDGKEIDAYQQIKGGFLFTYAYRVGDGVYYRIKSPVQKIDNATYSGGSTTSSGSHIYTIDNGHLIDDATDGVDNTLLLSRATYDQYRGAFPPSGWPTSMLEAP